MGYGFNPTLVRLRPKKRRQKWEKCACFNPTLVRLRPLAAGPVFLRRKRFNPTLVRLRPATVNVMKTPHAGEVSIPRWFD